MTMEAYIEKILAENPDFAAEMDERVKAEYADQISTTKNEYEQRLEAARKSWIENRGEKAFAENIETIKEGIKRKIARYCYIKNIVLSGDLFEVEIDLLKGNWSIVPV